MKSMELFLYETYAPQQRRAFARTKDTERNLIITLAAGKGTIIDAYARDEATLEHITKAYPGQEIGVVVRVRNDGDSDWLWITVKDKDTGAIIKNKEGIAYSFETDLLAGREWSNTLGRIIMPNKTWNLIAEAGHGRA